MALKRNFEKKAISLGFIILIATCLLQTTHGENSSGFDFSMNIENDKLTLKAEDSVTTTVSINLTSNSSEEISLRGEWTGEQQPQNVSVHLSNQSGIPPFSSNITFTSSGSETGNFVYHLIAEGKNVNHSSDIQINVTFNHTLTLQTGNESYRKGERIRMFGNITTTPPKNTVFSGNVTITLQHEKWKRYVTTLIQNSSYEYYYNISYGDPEGTWNITAKTEDKQGNTVSCYRNINVTLPSGTVRYKVVWFSPPEEAIYQRGTTFNISIFVTEDETGVKNASTSCMIPSMEKIDLIEIKQGYYRESYTLPWDSQIGPWTLSIESTKGTGDSLMAGGSNTSINIKPAILKLDLLEPSSNEYAPGEIIEIKVDLSYPDNSKVKNAIITAEIPSENLTLIEQIDGIYAVNYTMISEYEGSLIIEISASDQFGNNASATQVIYIIHREEQSMFPFITILGLIAVSLIGIFAVYFLWIHFTSQHFKDIQGEIQEIQRLQNEAAVKYYKEGSISRETYDVLRQEHTECLGELKKEERKIKK